MFELFTKQAIWSLMRAQEEARRLGHNFVGTEMLLLGLLYSGGQAQRVLEAQSINLACTRAEVEKIIGRGSGFVSIEIPFTPRGKRVLELSVEEAKNLHHTYIGTEHILLGILCEAERSLPEKPGIAQMVLQGLGVDLIAMRKELLELIES